jgi:hypothetical protein
MSHIFFWIPCSWHDTTRVETEIKILVIYYVISFQGRLEAGSTCAKNTGAEGAATVNRAPNAKGKGSKREMNTVKFWLEPALFRFAK